MPVPSPWIDLTPSDWRSLAQAHGTPFYLFDADEVARRARAVRQAFQGRVQVYYAIKANPNLGLLKAVLPSVDGVDISSGGELVQARLAGYDPAAMSFAGPAKTDAELEAAISSGVGCISAESLREIDVCARVAKELGRPAGLLLRVNPNLATRSYGLKMGGRAVQFGIDEDALPEAEARVLGHGPSLELRGIHAYVGSQCFEAAAVAEATRNALRILKGMQERTGITATRINLGGGFGLASSEERKELDLVSLAGMLAPDFEAFERSHPACRPLFELGRYLLADAGIYVVQVVDRKTSRGKSFVACDGGLNHQLAASGTFGAALRGNFPLRNLSRPGGALQTCNLAGPSCNPTDLLGIDATIAEPGDRDLLGVLLSGSYGLTASPLMFLGRPTPVELVRSHGAVTVGRRRHDITDFN